MGKLSGVETGSGLIFSLVSSVYSNLLMLNFFLKKKAISKIKIILKVYLQVPLRFFSERSKALPKGSES